MTPEDLEIIDVFVTEARELFDEAEPKLVALQHSEGAVGDPEAIQSLFSIFHAVGGAAECMGLERIARLTCAAESLVSVFRGGIAPVDPTSLELLLEVLDLVRQLIDRVQAEQTDAAADLQPVADDLCERLAKSQATSEQGTARLRAASPEGQIDSKELAPQFAQESEELLSKFEASLLAAERTPANAAEPLADAFRAVHSFKGNCGFMGFIPLERVAHRAETLLDFLRVAPPGSGSPMLAALLRALDLLRAGVEETSRTGGCAAEPLASVEGILDQAILAARGTAEPGRSASAPSEEAARPGQAPAMIERQDIRVGLQKLDNLMNLVGELVIAEAMVTGHPVVAQADEESLSRAVHLLRRVSVDLQDVAMAVRMVPVEGAFRKLVRLVHDLSIKLGKKVRLELLGEETEVDRSVIEQLSDPLMHLVRNAVDHGIEPSDERRRAGKPEEATVTVEARHESGEVLVTVSDDGRGLDRQRILAKAVECGLVHGSGDKLTDSEIYPLVFEPGFSTTDQLTDVSGRGVGMDVVRKNITKLGGRVELHSQAGSGTSVVLHIPLTLAIIDGMLLRVGQARYTLPLLSIREAFRPEPGQITVTPDGQEVARIRERLIPVVRLHEVFRRAADHQALHEGILVVVETNGQTMGLFADEILGQQQAVIKGLSGYLGGARGVSGCTILGDGEVSLIVDVAALFGLVRPGAAA